MLPRSVQEIADVLGTERALFLISQLPRCHWQDKRSPGTQSTGAILYIPRSVKPDHQLVRMLGWQDAQKMIRTFGGEILKPATACADLYRPFRDAGIKRMVGDGTPVRMVAEWFDMTERHVRNIVGEIPREERRAANQDNGVSHNPRRRKNDQIKKAG
jgi:hypothetical protein